jgi:hypothetical protein
MLHLPPSDSIVSEDVDIEPWTVATTSLTVSYSVLLDAEAKWSEKKTIFLILWSEMQKPYKSNKTNLISLGSEKFLKQSRRTLLQTLELYLTQQRRLVTLSTLQETQSPVKKWPSSRVRRRSLAGRVRRDSIGRVRRCSVNRVRLAQLIWCGVEHGTVYSGTG